MTVDRQCRRDHGGARLPLGILARLSYTSTDMFLDRAASLPTKILTLNRSRHAAPPA
jgi:hypothetical protein